MKPNLDAIEARVRRDLDSQDETLGVIAYCRKLEAVAEAARRVEEVHNVHAHLALDDALFALDKEEADAATT